MLPELKTGDVIVSRRGLAYRVHRVPNRGKHATEYEEPLYRLERVVLGNKRWTIEELNQEQMKLMEGMR